MINDFSIGKLNSKQPNLVEPVTLDHILMEIRESDLLKHHTQRLRKVRTLDTASYRKMKTSLPFFCWSRFKNNHRKKEFFEGTHWLCFDVDQFSTDQQELEELKNQLFRQVGVIMVYTSPSGTGVKMLVYWGEEITTSEEYARIYQALVGYFKDNYQLDGFIDEKTHDSSRISFLSFDEGVKFDSTRTAFPRQILEPFLQASKHSIEASKKWKTDQIKKNSSTAEKEQQIDYKAILAQLKKEQKPQKVEYTVPSKVQLVFPKLKHLLKQNELEIVNLSPISYGASITVKKKNFIDLGCANIYYGKKGYSVNALPKKGSNEDLNELLVYIIQSAIQELKANTHGEFKIYRNNRQA